MRAGFICISGMVEESKVSELRAAGANDFMHKPFDVERLIERMCHHLDIEVAPHERPDNPAKATTF